MTYEPRRRLSGAELDALKFAAHRQIARWSTRPQLRPNQQAQRTAPTCAVRVLQEDAFTGGCELHSCTDEQHADA
jgi:hypothetical protein